MVLCGVATAVAEAVAAAVAADLNQGLHSQVCVGDRRVGWDQDDVWFAHCCCLDDDEVKQWADHGIGIAHCPSSNVRLASGIAPVSSSSNLTCSLARMAEVVIAQLAKGWRTVTVVAGEMTRDVTRKKL